MEKVITPPPSGGNVVETIFLTNRVYKKPLQTIGVLTGLGPIAGARLHTELVLRAAKDYNCSEDTEYPPLIFKTADFGLDVHGAGVPYKKLKDELTQLQKWGGEILALNCNTLYHYPQLLIDFKNNLINLPKEVMLETIQKTPNVTKIAVFTSHTSWQHQVYQKMFNTLNIEVINSKPFQEKIDLAIKLSMAGKNYSTPLQFAIDAATSKEAQSIVLGCTELSYDKPSAIKIVDSLQVLAKSLLRQVYGEGR